MPQFVKAGDTSKYIAKLKNFAGVLADPVSVTFNVYNHTTRSIITTGAATKESTGVYYYYYTAPTDLTGCVVFEFVGVLDGYPIIARDLLIIEWP